MQTLCRCSANLHQTLNALHHNALFAFKLALQLAEHYGHPSGPAKLRLELLLGPPSSAASLANHQR